ncbi:R3H and coiled-coil domain-containing protein 1-like isoform X1 [Rhizophagus irregularis DAOM 181602=DAOM 197198]|nr:R3H and coiled-coil domain-containing protein 1-like isoform X1 [Rhizophagus irregularis DAOM 181602=DAOM 197198]CAG8637408.1 17106_t:CDS:2 [Rhizophagus irregularis]
MFSNLQGQQCMYVLKIYKDNNVLKIIRIAILSKLQGQKCPQTYKNRQECPQITRTKMSSNLQGQWYSQNLQGQQCPQYLQGQLCPQYYEVKHVLNLRRQQCPQDYEDKHVLKIYKDNNVLGQICPQNLQGQQCPQDYEDKNVLKIYKDSNVLKIMRTKISSKFTRTTMPSKL